LPAPGSSNPRVADENEKRPDPFPTADGVDEHPDLEQKKEQEYRRGDEKIDIEEI
jgi:hypothetical protein